MDKEILLSLEEREIVEEKFSKMLEICLRIDPNADVAVIRKAMDVAMHAHRFQRRKTGEPYIYHPIEVAQIVCEEMKLDGTSVICALLHDVVEDNEKDYPSEKIEEIFGNDIAFIVSGLTKIRKLQFNHKKVSRETETIQKMVWTIPKDIRVIFIKIADRLHNMRTLYGMGENKQIEKTAETLHIYAPLAYRLGLYSIKVELENLGLEYCEPIVFKELKAKSDERDQQMEWLLAQFKSKVEGKLEELGFRCEFDIRKKSLYTVWKNMNQDHQLFDDAYNYSAFRVIFDDEGPLPTRQQAFIILSVLTQLYFPKAESWLDHLKTPMGNGFQAMMIDLMGIWNKWVEVQIVPKSMLEYADAGYKLSQLFDPSRTVKTDLDLWIETVEQQHHKYSDIYRSVDNFQIGLEASVICCITPKGMPVYMRKGATVLDFAYHIHSELGDQCTGATVNYKNEGIDYVLQNADQINILYSSAQHPLKEWINIAKTVRAKDKIRDYFKKLEKYNTGLGRSLFIDFQRENKLDVTDEQMQALLLTYGCASEEQFYMKVGEEGINTKELLKELKGESTPIMSIPNWILGSLFGSKESSPPPVPKILNADFDPKKPLNTDSIERFTFANCCHPIAGEDAVAYKEDDGNISIHTALCDEAIRISAGYGQRLVKLIWGKTDRFVSQRTLEIMGSDNIGIVNNVTSALSSELNVYMSRIHFEAFTGVFRGWIEINVQDSTKLKLIVEKLKKIKHVSNVRQIPPKDDVFPFKENKF